MAYSNFTLEGVLSTFQLEKIESIGLFSEIEPVTLRPHFKTELAEKASLAATIRTEKARSELIVADVLFELRKHLNRRISLFSGIDFNVDAENDLTGVCDFLISLSPGQLLVDAPVIVLVEAKKEDLIGGLGQCIAEIARRPTF